MASKKLKSYSFLKYKKRSQGFSSTFTKFFNAQKSNFFASSRLSNTILGLFGIKFRASGHFFYFPYTSLDKESSFNVLANALFYGP